MVGFLRTVCVCLGGFFFFVCLFVSHPVQWAQLLPAAVSIYHLPQPPGLKPVKICMRLLFFCVGGGLKSVKERVLINPV